MNLWFLADVDSPHARAIRERLPPRVQVVPWPDDSEWPEDLPLPEGPGALVAHRSTLSVNGAKRLRLWRARRPEVAQVVVAHGPGPRAGDLDRWGAVVEALVPDAIAPDVIARRLGPWERPLERPRVTIVSSLFDLRMALVDSVRELGAPVVSSRDWSRAPHGGLAIWDVPVLEPDWPSVLSRACRSRRVVALLGLADRESVALARGAGASACLPSPYDDQDLAFVLDRLALEAPTDDHAPKAHEPWPFSPRSLPRALPPWT